MEKNALVRDYQYHIDAYTQMLRNINSPDNTIRNYVTYMEQFLSWLDKNKEVQDLCEIPWAYFREYEGYLQKVRGLKGNTVNQHICAIKKYFEVVLERDWNNKAVPKVKFDKFRGAVPIDNEVITIIKNANGINQRLEIALMAFCGLRVDELVRLTFSDIRHARNTLYVKKSKGHEDREVPLSPTLISLLTRYVQSLPKPWPKPEDYIFPGRNPGRHVTTTTVEKHLYAVLKKLGWEDRNYTCHSFRKYFGCTQYLAHPDDMPRLAAIMGHSSLSSTMVYIRLAAAFKAAMDDFKRVDELMRRAEI